MRLARSVGPRGEDAEDIVQHAFVYLWRRMNRASDAAVASPRGLLNVAIRNVSAQIARNRRRVQACGLMEEVPAPVDGSTALDHDDAVRLLQSLPAWEREVMWLRVIDGLSIHEVAQSTGLPEGTIRSRSHRATCRLRDRSRAVERGKARVTGADAVVQRLTRAALSRGPLES